ADGRLPRRARGARSGARIRARGAGRGAAVRPRGRAPARDHGRRAAARGRRAGRARAARPARPPARAAGPGRAQPSRAAGDASGCGVDPVRGGDPGHTRAAGLRGRAALGAAARRRAQRPASHRCRLLATARGNEPCPPSPPRGGRRAVPAVDHGPDDPRRGRARLVDERALSGAPRGRTRARSLGPRRSGLRRRDHVARWVARARRGRRRARDASAAARGAARGGARALRRSRCRHGSAPRPARAGRAVERRRV
ncbi:MAG: hypothetical protein AVDCRST_MAG45-1989, partial [uncultured Solirubrobacterales bacterium]